MRRYSRTGWVRKGELESETLASGGFTPEELKDMLHFCVHASKALAMEVEGGEVERVRVSVTVDVERI